MKKNYVAIALLISVILLCGCDDNDGPNVNTESQTDTQSESREHTEDSWKVAFRSVGKVLRSVDAEEFEASTNTYHIISCEEEWLYWADENIPGWKTCEGVDDTAVDWEKEYILVSETTQTSKGSFSYVNPMKEIMIQGDKLVITHSDEEISELVKIENDVQNGCYYQAFEIVSISQNDLTEKIIAEYLWSEKSISKLELYTRECIFHKVTKEEYENRLPAGMVMGIASTKAEWEAWANENFSEWKNSGLINSYDEKLFENYALLIYQCEKNEAVIMASMLECIYSDGQTLKCVERNSCDAAVLDDSKTKQYYIPYQLCWVKKDALSEAVIEKYKFDQIYHLDNSLAHYVYMDVNKHEVIIETTRDGGFSWERNSVKNDEWSSSSNKVFASFIDDNTGYLLQTGDAAMGHMPKMLWVTYDGGQSWKEVLNITTQISRYPKKFVFFDEKVGYIMTDYVLSPYSSDSGYILYRTEDGGVTWESAELPYTDDVFENMIGITIERISETKGLLVLGIYDTIYGSTINVLEYNYYTEDAGKTWKRIDDVGSNWKLIQK